ncbi:GAF domain-containing sensor histidine kinase [Pedobacter rhodius]|uniref:histidine kinase n=1 Tax=Pedobacter rhodius TaxID=3004098 RepID=A0ABT4KWX7_9SPHI|nr:GAF domain-containing sensor histidine kinase [Pedobacter sp. SJ11]MCZ4223440.1 GAF domain-containing sensor histidine kinase [Pedobacter sp. SJ11]
MEPLSKVDIQRDIEAVAKIPIISNILEVVCKTTGMGFSAIARVTADRWIACATNDQIGFGLTVGGELKLDTTICNEIRQHYKSVAIDNVSEDEEWKHHHTPQIYGLQSYISVPIILKNGEFFGTLCAIDPNPAQVNNKHTLDTFHLFADLISFHLSVLNDLSDAEDKNQKQQEEGEIREQFIAMLGHDLRNPVNAISNAVQLQLRSNMDDRNLKLAKIIQDATMRTRGLIDNILDFARGRLGGGINLNFDNTDDLETTLKEVVTEFNIIVPETKINLELDLIKPVKADNKRIAQLFSNLLGNAISHGDQGKPVQVSAKSGDDGLELSIINLGKPIDEATKAHLFKPFSRGKVKHGQEGLGLGLYIASEITKAHGGEIIVNSSALKTCFTVKLPVGK